MKKALLFITIGFLVVISSSYSQEYWKTYDKDDGLIDSVVTDLAISQSKIYIATPRGFSIFENETFTNFDTSNSDLPDNNILQILQFEDTVYLVTNKGLTQFFDQKFITYTTDSGLISNSITDIALNSKGEIWISSLAGLSQKVGNTFLNDNSRNISYIGFNKGDSLYANVNGGIISNNTNRVDAELLVNGNWSTLRDPNQSGRLDNADFVQLSNGELVITSESEAGAYLVKNTFDLIPIDFNRNSLDLNDFRSIEIDSNGSYWLAFANDLRPTGLLKSLGGQTDFHFGGLPSSSVNVVKTRGRKIYIGTNNGFAVAVDSIITNPPVLNLETKSLRATFSSNGLLFTNQLGKDDDVAGFEFPKDSARDVMYGSDLWLKAKRTDGNSLLASPRRRTEPTFLTEVNDFREGAMNSNGPSVSRNMIFITKEEIAFHLKNFRDPSYKMPKSIKDWPANGKVDLGEFADQAPFIDVDRDGCYDPEQGDSPAILGDKAIYMVINDANRSIANNRNGFDVEIQIMTYVFDIPTVDYIDRSVFVRYTLVNRSDQAYIDLRAGIAADFDVGNLFDDASGCDPGSNIMFGFNGDAIDEPTAFTPQAYNAFPPFVGVKSVNRQLSGFTSFSNTGLNSKRKIDFDTQSLSRVMDYQWIDGSPITFGGNGYDRQSLDTTRFMYPGDLSKDNEWSFLNPLENRAANLPESVFGLGIFELDTLLPSDRITIDLVYGITIDSSLSDNLDNYHLMVDNLNRAARFQQGVDSIAPEFSYANCTVGLADRILKTEKEEKVLIYPNPTKREINLLANHSIEQVVIYDLQGREVQNIVFNQKAILQKLTLNSSLQNGLYLVRSRLSNGQESTQQILLNP